MTLRTLTLTLISLGIVLCALVGQAQIRIDALTVISPNTLVTVVSPGQPMTITQPLLNQGRLEVNSSNVVVDGNGELSNQDTLRITGNLTSNSRPIVNNSLVTGFFSVLGNISMNGSATITNTSSNDSIFTSGSFLLNGTSQFINQGGRINVVQNITTSNTSNIFNLGVIRVAGDYTNNGAYGAATDSGAIRLVGTSNANFFNGPHPVYRLRINTSAIKTMTTNTTVVNSLDLNSGVLRTAPLTSLFLDSSARIIRPSDFDPANGGHVDGRLRRVVESNAGVDQLDSLFFPMGIGNEYTPFLVRNMTPMGPNALFSVTTSAPGTGISSFDVDPPLNAAITWRLDQVNPPASFRVQALASTTLIGPASTDSLVVAQSNVGDGVYESLGKIETFSSGNMRGITSEYQPDLPFMALGVNKNVKLSLKVLLQGRSNGLGTMVTNGTFTDTLGDRFNDRIIEAYRPIPINVIDSISVSIRSTPFSLDLETIPAWLMADGSIRDFRTITDTSITFAKALDISYYIVVRHRNHLTLMSSNPVSLVSNSRGQTDLTQISNIYGGGVYAVTGTIGAMYAGNTRNIDQEVNAGDQFDAVFGNINLLTGYDRRDVNLDAVVNGLDVGIADEGSFSLYFSTTP